MENLRARIFMALLLVSLFASGCTGGDAVDIRGDWSLVSYGDASAPVQALPGVETNVTFGADGSVGGTFGCNSFGGTYSVDSDSLSIGSLVATEMFCEQTSEQESAVFAILSGSDLAMDLAEGVMTLTTADGASVVVLQRK